MRRSIATTSSSSPTASSASKRTAFATKHGRLHAVDTIIEATGFRPFDITDYVDIRGRGGRRLRDALVERASSRFAP